MVTRSRGNCQGNLIAMLAGFIVVAILSNLPNDVAKMFGGQLYAPPGWLPIIEFPWRIAFGTVVTFLVAVCFRTDIDPVPSPSPADNTHT
jgi:membrane protein implicated in regulation of membrane protease activity